MPNSGAAQIGNVDLVKQLNGAAVYGLIDQNGPISRIQVAELSQLAPASVTKITRQLLERGLVKEVEQQASTGGRRAISIVTETRPFHTVAVRLGRKDATVALFDLSSKVLVEQSYPLSAETQEGLQQQLFTIIEHFIAENKNVIRELIAISVILPGLVDPENGKVRYMPHIAVDQWPLVEALNKTFKLASFVGHDIRSLALAEYYFGAGSDCSDSLLVRIHRGAGAGVIINENIFVGRNGNAVEIGHIQVDPLGEQCACGHFGCLETVVSNPAIEKRVKQLLLAGQESSLSAEACTIHDICRAANLGDSLATEVLKHAAVTLGKVIASSINLFNPQKVIIAGEITAADAILFPIIQRCIDTQTLNAFGENLPVVSSQLGNRSAIGAFALVKRAMLNGKLLQHLLDDGRKLPS
ncbi:DNA-binding transcriptional regulator NagC [Rosenbergiella nectarea]|uniref:DNA-binding transcriptional regulator NagC n=1 Tax=Rosenbergiella nectarea TaxID=988801 RepID=UPI001BDA57C8|nr:ROK family protein [Rosenbergiella nectarea]MBT0731442.1 ROK family protein [Rosenbergiella nectarea subsp. apis]